MVGGVSGRGNCAARRGTASSGYAVIGRRRPTSAGPLHSGARRELLASEPFVERFASDDPPPTVDRPALTHCAVTDIARPVHMPLNKAIASGVRRAPDGDTSPQRSRKRHQGGRSQSADAMVACGCKTARFCDTDQRGIRPSVRPSARGHCGRFQAYVTALALPTDVR